MGTEIKEGDRSCIERRSLVATIVDHPNSIVKLDEPKPRRDETKSMSQFKSGQKSVPPAWTSMLL